MTIRQTASLGRLLWYGSLVVGGLIGGASALAVTPARHPTEGVLMFTLAFWRATLERVISSIAGGALAALGSDALGVFDVDFGKVASVALLAGLVSLLKALIVGKATDGGPSLGNAETLNPAAPEKSVAVPAQADGAALRDGLANAAAEPVDPEQFRG